MTCSSNDLPGSLKTSTRSVITTGPLAAMLTTRNSMLSMPGAPGRMNAAIVLAIASLPVTGASGILWYTASSVKNAASSATPTLSDHAAQNLRTSSIGLSIWLLLRSILLALGCRRELLVRRCGHILRRRSRLEGRMNETDRHRALADRGRAAFDRSAPNISRGEHPRQTRLEEKRRPPLCAPEIAAHRIERHGRTRQDETLLVKLHAATQPFGVRIGPDEEKQRRRFDSHLARGIVADVDRLEMTVSFQGGHDGASVNLDIGDLLDAIDEVSRHALSQIPAPRDDVHASRVSRQRHDGLPGRIAGAHDDDLLVATELRFRVRRGIVDAGALELA